MMVDVDPDLRAADSRQGIVAEPLPSRGIERKHDVEIFGFAGGSGNQLPTGKKGKLLEQSLFVPNLHFLAQLPESESECDLTAERVAVRTDMAEHDKDLVTAQD